MVEGFRLAFDDPAYIESLSWLGQPRLIGGIAAVARAFGPSHHDLRGSWPYQSMLSFDQIAKVADTGRGLSYTIVVRPDVDGNQIERELGMIGSRFAVTHRILKKHLSHLPDSPPARQRYSGRTKLRLAEAEAIFSVEQEAIGPSHRILSEWQDRLAVLRHIPRISSPDLAHFQSLVQAGMKNLLDISAMTLRWKRSGTIAGIFLLLAGADRTWHGHSFLVEPDAIKNHGTYMLFDRTITTLGDRPIWFGGAPAGPNGQGVFNFKERFSNASSPARIVSIDLDRQALERVRAQSGTFAWLPNYRDPAVEILPVSAGSFASSAHAGVEKTQQAAAAVLISDTLSKG